MFKVVEKSTYAKEFYTYDLDAVKENAVWQTGNMTRDMHNRVSAYIFDNLEYVFENIKSAFSFVTFMRDATKILEHLAIPSAALQSSIFEDVFTAYKNKLAAVKDSFYYHSLTDTPDKDKYGHVIGYKNGPQTDIHKLANDMKYFAISDCQSYIQYLGKLDSRLKKAKKDYKKADATQEEKDKAFKTIEKLTLCKEVSKRHGEDVWKLVYERILHKMQKAPVFFRTRNFETACRSKSILEPNKNKDSVIAAFTTITFPTYERMRLPLKFSKAYHGDFSHYNHEVAVNEKGKEVVKNNFYSVMIVFDYNDILLEHVKWMYMNKERVHMYKMAHHMLTEYKPADNNLYDYAKEWKDKKFHIVLPYKNDRQLAVVDESTPSSGVDCNTSRMLLAASDETTYGGEKFDRLKYFISRREFYECKYKGAKNMNSRGRYLRSMKNFDRKIDGLRHELIVDLIKDRTSFEKNREYVDGVRPQQDAAPELHIVVEELTDTFGKSNGQQVLDKKQPDKKYNSNDVTHGLKLSSIKKRDIVNRKHIQCRHVFRAFGIHVINLSGMWMSYEEEPQVSGRIRV